jgi:hypothetical protein
LTVAAKYHAMMRQHGVQTHLGFCKHVMFARRHPYGPSRPLNYAYVRVRNVSLRRPAVDGRYAATVQVLRRPPTAVDGFKIASRVTWFLTTPSIQRDGKRPSEYVLSQLQQLACCMSTALAMVVVEALKRFSLC